MTEFHADDYGLFIAQSKRILSCRKDGALNGISIFANGEQLDLCMAALDDDPLLLTVHLNLIQGHCAARPEEVALLVDQNGVFSARFVRLLFCAFTGRRAVYREQLKREIRAQIRLLLPYVQQRHAALRLDGHAHWHMIPVVFDAMMEVIQEDSLDVSYIRIPREPVGLYCKMLPKLLPFHPINIVKSLLLYVLAGRNQRRWSGALSAMEKKLFLGVLLSGNFDLRRMRTLLPEAEKLASRRNCGLEILAHPGAVYEQADVAKITNRDDYCFFTSSARDLEADALKKILS